MMQKLEIDNYYEPSDPIDIDEDKVNQLIHLFKKFNPDFPDHNIHDLVVLNYKVLSKWFNII